MHSNLVAQFPLENTTGIKNPEKKESYGPFNTFTYPVKPFVFQRDIRMARFSLIAKVEFP